MKSSKNLFTQSSTCSLTPTSLWNTTWDNPTDGRWMFDTQIGGWASYLLSTLIVMNDSPQGKILGNPLPETYNSRSLYWIRGETSLRNYKKSSCLQLKPKTTMTLTTEYSDLLLLVTLLSSFSSSSAETLSSTS